MGIFRNNLGVLRKRWPSLAKSVEQTVVPSELKILKTNSRYPTLALDLHGKYVLFHSREHPIREVREQVRDLVIPVEKNVLFLGCGLGYHIREIFSRIPKESYVFLIEQYMPIFRLCLEYCDLRDLLANPHFVPVIGRNPEQVFDDLKGYIFQLVNNDLIVLRHDTSCLLFGDYYREVEKKIRDLIVWGKKNFEAGVRFRREYQRNIIKNLGFFLSQPGIESLDFTSSPVIIVGAGPSLERNFSDLRRLMGEIPIIAVDTALKPLLREGVVPTVVVSIDPTPQNFAHFRNVHEFPEVKNIPLVIDPQVYYEIPRSYPGPILAPRLADSKLHDFWADLVRKESLGKGMSVAHTCFSLAIQRGCSAVIFVGLDLSFREDATHVKGAANFSSSLRGRRLMRVPGRGGEVITDDVFFSYIKHFEVEIAKAGIPVLNASFGAAIKGAEFVDLSSAWNFVSEASREAVRKVMLALEGNLDRVVGDDLDWELVEKKVESLIEGFREVGRLSKEALEKDEDDFYRMCYTILHKRFSEVTDIVEETMESAGVILANRGLWKEREAKDKFRFYFEQAMSTSRFLLEEVRDADIVGWARRCVLGRGAH